MDKPLVSVICLNYNHAPFLEEAIGSVLNQTYSNIELIIVDDASTDNSLEVIERISKTNPNIRIIKNEHNQGNCKSFNKGYKESKGDFLIDLSADDVLIEDSIEEGVNAFLRLPNNYGVHFSDAELIDKNGNHIRYHYKRDRHGKLKTTVPQGYIYPELLERYFICTPTMMFKRSLLDNLGGYDETLAYEDFDFWIRSAKLCRYAFTDRILVKKRILPGSMSDNQYVPNSKLLDSTLKVCLKTVELNENERDRIALVRRIRYELKQSIIYGNKDTIDGFYKLLIQYDRNIIFKLFFRIWIGLKK